MTAFTYDPVTRRYRGPDGKLITLAALIALRDQVATQTGDDATALTTAYLTRSIRLSAWAEQFAALVTDGVTAGYLLGRGGANVVTPADDATLAPVLETQLTAAKGFGAALAESTAIPILDDNGAIVDPENLNVDENGDVVDENGDPVTVNGIEVTESWLEGLGAAYSGVSGLLARAGSYESAAIAGYSAGQSASWDGAELPMMPPAHPSCACSTSFRVADDGQILGSWDAQAGCCVLCSDLDAEYTDYETGVYVTDASAVGDGGE
jgi:hypothetical protein